MFTKIKTRSHCETLCAECLRMLDAGGLSRQIPGWGEDIIVRGDVTERAPAPGTARCTWCGPESRWLGERLYSRLPAGQRGILRRQATRRARGRAARLGENHPFVVRRRAILGRLMSLPE